MNPIQESKQELEASIRYAENAIVKANQTIESMATYQEQTGREAALQNKVGELKSECAVLAERIDEMKDGAFADANTIKHLKAQYDESKTNMALMEDQNLELKEKVQELFADIAMLKHQRTVRAEEREMLEKNVKYLRDENERQKRDLTVKTSQAEAWKKEARATKEGAPTMPVIPKAVAIAIFREGMAYGAGGVCDEIDNETINISESDYVGDFSISFERDIDLVDYLDTDYLRSKAVDNCDDEWVVDCLKTLMECADNKFECRIHGVGDNTIDLTKKND